MSRWSCVMAWASVTAATGSPTARLFLWAGGLVIVVVLTGFTLGRFRKWMHPGVRAPSADSWGLQDLRVLRRQGRISEQEFETLKAAIIAEYQPKADPAEKAGESPD